MKNNIFLLLTFVTCILQESCARKVIAAAIPDDTIVIAFPGAEGYGKYTTGGRGGKVFVVTNLNDDGEGSLRKGLKLKEPAIIVFAVAGTIHLESPLNIPENTTIAGQTAPGEGICLADQPVTIKGDNVIVRYMRFRLGDKNQNKGMVNGSGHDDAFGGSRRKHIIIDHCSMSWSTDEAFSVYAGDSTTLQWNLIAEPLNYSYHFETGDTDFEKHGYGGIIGGRHTSMHHNLYAHCLSRTPRFEGNRNILPDMEFVDFRNNVIYNWGGNNIYGAEGGRYNLVNNYYKFGPNTSEKVKFQIFNPYKKDPDIPFGQFYVNGNYVDGNFDVTKNNWSGVKWNNGTDKEIKQSKLAQPIPSVEIVTQSTWDAYDAVLAKVGASFKRDTLDKRIINDVLNRTGKIIDVQGGYPHGTPYEKTIDAWPNLQVGIAQKDADGDGMPDTWEASKGLNPNDKTDAAKKSLHAFYTNIEMYVNSLVQ